MRDKSNYKHYENDSITLPLPLCCGLCLRPHLYPDSDPGHGALRVPLHG